MEKIPCDKLRPEQGPVCYLGRNTVLECTGCGSWDKHPEPTSKHWEIWEEIRTGGATRSASDGNSGGREGSQ